MIIIGITGTLGAGKGTVVEFLARKYNFAHYSVREYLVEEIKKRNLAVNRDTMTSVANEIRASHSSYFIVEKLYNKAVEKNNNTIIESIRTPGEVSFLKGKKNFYLLAIDADPEKRYQRIRLRKSATDHITFEEFLLNEKREMHSDNPSKQNLHYCISHADFTLANNGAIEELYRQVNNIVLKIIYNDK